MTKKQKEIRRNWLFYKAYKRRKKMLNLKYVIL